MIDRIAAQLRRVDQTLRQRKKLRAIERVTGPLTPVYPAGMREPPPVDPNDPRLARLQPDFRLELRIEPTGKQ